MDYPTLVANGWSIGSDAVESACKTVVGQCLKLAEYVGGNTAPMRCAISGLCSSGEAGQWQVFWRSSAPVKVAT
jgi:hypothetical protein